MKKHTILGVVLSVTIAACSVSAAVFAPVVSDTPTDLSSSEIAAASTPSLSASSVLSSPSTEPGPSPDPTLVPSPGGTTIVRAYFFLEGPVGSAGLVPITREIPATMAVARAALNALLDGPSAPERRSTPAVSSAIPTGTELLGLSITDGVATVDLSSEFESGGGSSSCLGRLGQVVYTLTQFGSVDSVALRVDGRPVSVFGCEDIVLDGPVGRETDALGHTMFEAVLPAIFVDGPAWNAPLDNPGRLTGTADTYEAWITVALFNASGGQIFESQATATCGSGCRGMFDITFAYLLSTAQWGTLRVFDGDESGQTDGVSRDYPVWLSPGQPEREHTCGC
jgi:germination protein M